MIFLIHLHRGGGGQRGWDKENGMMVMQSNCKIITVVLGTLCDSSGWRELLFSPTLERPPHQLALPLRVCESHVKTEFVQKRACKSCNTNVGSVSRPLTCSDRLRSSRISPSGGPPLTITRAPKPGEQLPLL